MIVSVKDPSFSLRRDFEGLCVAHYANILRYLTALTQDRHQAQDLAQDTFLAAYRSLDRFRIGGDFGAYLRGIARNLFLKSLRGTARVERTVLDGVDALFERETTAGVDGLAALDHCIQRLQTGDRDLIDAHYARGIAIRDLARLYGRSEPWVKVVLYRIRRKLKACLERKLAAGGAIP